MLACSRGNKDQQYKTEKVDRGDITMTVTATGTLSAVTTVQVGSQVSGVIARLYADFNSRVKKGQLLAELDPTPFQQQVEQRQADVSKAKIDAANSKISLDRQSRLLQAGLASQADYDAAKAQYDGAVALVQQSVASLKQAQTNLTYTKIISPIDGIVVDRQYDVGQTVAASFQAPTLFSIAQDLTKMQVQADVDQSDIGSVKVGQVSRFTVDSYPDQEFRGQIAQIRLNATVSQNVVTYPVIIVVPNPDEKLRPKMTANVTIEVAKVEDVLRVANAALRFKPQTGAEGAAGRQGAQRGAQSGAQAVPRAARRPAASARVAAALLAPPARIPSAPWPRWVNAVPESLVLRHRGCTADGSNKQRGGQNVYILDANNKVKPVWIRTGITDGHYTQVVGGDLKPSDSVIVGLSTSKVEGPPPPGGARRGPMGR